MLLFWFLPILPAVTFHAGGRDFRKKSTRLDSLTNLGESGQNEDVDGAFFSGNNELVYEV